MVAANSPPSPPPGADNPPKVPKAVGPRTTEPMLAIPVAVIATIAAWIAIDRSYGAIPKPAMSEEYLKEAEAKYTHLQDLSPHLLAEYEFKRQVFLYRNTALSMALAGGAFGLCFGVLAGAERNRAFRAPIGASVGALAGALFGAAAGYAGSAVSEFAERHKFEPRSPAEMQQVWLREMYTSMSIHAVEWSIIGIGVALVFITFGHLTRSRGRTLAAALGAGLLAAVAFTPLAAMLFPDAKSNLAVPDGFLNRLLFVLLSATALTLLLILQRSRPVAGANDLEAGERASPIPAQGEGGPRLDAASRARRYTEARKDHN